MKRQRENGDNASIYKKAKAGWSFKMGNPRLIFLKKSCPPALNPDCLRTRGNSMGRNGTLHWRALHYVTGRDHLQLQT